MMASWAGLVQVQILCPGTLQDGYMVIYSIYCIDLFIIRSTVTCIGCEYVWEQSSADCEHADELLWLEA